MMRIIRREEWKTFDFSLAFNNRSENVMSMICSKNWPLYDTMLVNLCLNVMIYSYALSLVLFFLFLRLFSIATNQIRQRIEIDFHMKSMTYTDRIVLPFQMKIDVTKHGRKRLFDRPTI